MPNRPTKTPVKAFKTSAEAAEEIMKKMGEKKPKADDKVMFNMQMTAEMREALKTAAAENQMTAAGYVKWLLNTALKAGGYM